ncbi:MAG: immunity protein Imm33 domain-containing protein [Pseudoalteromonas sp.]|uniref:immunity protein Imm33 domain-containing protein n=1 Tax=unclassified Pseudoalteromonas TaxID=194690 RepID=UPI003F991CDA
MLTPSWQLEDAQKLADEFPYTFYKPSDQVMAQLEVGDLVKLIFEFTSDNPDDPTAERMWVEIAEIKDDSFMGYLNNEPAFIEDLKHQDSVEFRRCHIVDIYGIEDPVPSLTDKYIKRCFVTHNILYDGQEVGFLYREPAESEDDSGWRITTGYESDEYLDDSKNASYVSLGAVLRQDDSIVELLENEVGAAYIKDKQGNFVEYDE